MLNFKNYSEFTLWIDEHYNEVTPIVEYDDWSVVRIGYQYWYYEHDIEDDSDTFYPVVPVATLHYDMINDIKNDRYLPMLFDNDMCGEQVLDEEIIYWWFKEIKEEE